MATVMDDQPIVVRWNPTLLRLELHESSKPRVCAVDRQRVNADARALERELVAKHNLKFVHVRGMELKPNQHNTHYDIAVPAPKGGVTVAFTLPPYKGGRIIKASCAMCHENDSYNKAEGRLRAAARFDAGSSIELRVPRNMPISAFLKSMFGAML